MKEYEGLTFEEAVEKQNKEYLGGFGENNMSCISKLLEIKGKKDVLIDGKIAIEGGGIYKGYEYLITFVHHGHRCGYVAIPVNHSIYHEDHENGYPDLNVHGGISYFGESRFEDLIGEPKCADKWIGFDAAHCDDLSDIETSVKYFGELNEFKYTIPRFSMKSEHRSYFYMENECKRLIDQLIEKY